MNRSNSAFTLAETLITLVVVGIIASITVPTVSRVHQKEEVLTKLKKTYSALHQTTYKAIMDYGPTTTWPTMAGNSRNTAKYFSQHYIIPYLSTSDICTSNTGAKCQYNFYNLNGSKFSMPDNTYRFYLADGTFIIVWAQTTETEASARIFFDINGPRKPNRFGRDVYKLEYWVRTTSSARAPQVGKVTPAYFNYDRDTILTKNNNEYCNRTKQGAACLAVILKDGWRISDDYPW